VRPSSALASRGSTARHSSDHIPWASLDVDEDFWRRESADE
jgi:hypothetical protein